jgi:chemotaxis protein methyltransferase CheR
LLKYIECSTFYEIEFIDTIESDDLKILEKLFQSRVGYFKLFCKDFYNLPLKFIELVYLYQETYHKKIEIGVSHNKLSKYLHKLGFTSVLHLEEFSHKQKDLSANILVLGGSSNSSEKIIKILSTINVKYFAIFIVQHISAKLESHFDDILANHINSDVHYAIDGEYVRKGSIYIAPKDRHLRVENGYIFLDNSSVYNSARPSISVTFESLSKEYGSKLLAYLSCGYKFDGVDSLNTLNSNASTILIQNPSECDVANSIPSLAMKKGLYDYVLKTEGVIDYINLITLDLNSKDRYIEYLLEIIYKHYEYDYREYNRESITRRVEQFMIQYRVKTMIDLLVMIRFKKNMFQALFLSLSVNITNFFRKEESSTNMIELINKEHKNCYNIKIWCAGCSTGKEAYSTAIILEEMGLLHKSTIYATDINSVVIEEAKNGLYCVEAYENALNVYGHFGFKHPLSDYFTINKSYVKIHENIKKKILFFVHNLEKDTVFNEFTIIECKNVMIYFDDLLKEHVFQLFYDSLKFGGHLLLGESEEISPNFLDRFEKCRGNCKIYRKIA